MVDSFLNHKKIKTLVFSILLFLPLFFLSFLCFLFFKDVHKINNVTPAEISQAVSKYFDYKERVPAKSFPIFGESKFPKDNKLRNLKESHFLVYVFGASSLVNSDGSTFHRFLEKKLSQVNPNVRVLNFGKRGITSFEVKQRIVDVFEKVKIKPDAVVLYLGHNDYNNVYKYVACKPYVEFEPFLKASYFFSKTFQRHKFKRKHNYPAHADLYRPKILNFLQKSK